MRWVRLSAHRILNNLEQGSAPIRIDRVANRHADRLVMVESVSVGQIFIWTLQTKRNDVCHLPTVRVDDTEPLATTQIDHRSGAGFEAVKSAILHWIAVDRCENQREGRAART